MICLLPYSEYAKVIRVPACEGYLKAFVKAAY